MQVWKNRKWYCGKWKCRYGRIGNGIVESGNAGMEEEEMVLWKVEIQVWKNRKWYYGKWKRKYGRIGNGIMESGNANMEE